jgi:SulP family sulfate permease
MLLAHAMRPLPGNAPLVQAIQKHGEQVFGEKIPALGTPLYTDVRLFCEAGIPGVIYGAGPSHGAGVPCQARRRAAGAGGPAPRLQGDRAQPARPAGLTRPRRTVQALSPRTGDPSWWWRLLPFLRWWPLLNRQTLRADAIAGLTGGLVLVPQGVAFATIAGMPPQYGLYAAMLPAIIAALWGSSWHLVSGPTTAISIVVFATMSPLAPPGSPEYVGLVLTLTLLVGVFQLLLGLLRMGTLVNFVSHTVVVGFTTGAAVLIASSQVRNFFGITVARGASVWEVLDALAHQLSAINPYITSVALLTVACSVLSRRWWPRFPHMIAGLLAGSLLAALLNHLFGVQRTGIGSIGALQIGLPPLSAPDLSIEAIRQITPIAMAVAVLALTEAVSISRAVALKSGQRIDGNQEFIGQGLSNLAAPSSPGMPPAAPSTAAG